MSTYIAWDGNEYPLPTPEGWYLGADDRWWPEGHGPGPAVSADRPGELPSAAPPADRTIYSAPLPGSGSGSTSGPIPGDESGKRAMRVVLPVFALLALVGLGVITFIRSGSDDAPEAVTATTVPTATLDDENPQATQGDGAAATTVTTAPPGRGARANPYTIGETMTASYTDVESGEIRTWNIEVVAPPSDITEAVLEENQFNQPPEDDRRYIGVPLRVTYVSGPEPASLFELTFKAFGPTGVVLTTFNPSCGVIPDALDTLAELTQGGVLEGNVCWSAVPADTEDLTMLIEVFLEDTEIYVDLSG